MVQLQCSVTEKARIGTSFLTITVCGFAATIGQIVILRELLVLFYGNELSTGLIFASWLLWTAMGSGVAGHYGTRMIQSAVLLPTLLAMIALLLPVSVLWIRAARIIWTVPVGETIHPLLMLCISLSGTGLFCLASGVLFGLAWSSLAMTSGRGAGQPLTIYVGEALGAALGGLFFYFILLPRASILNATLITSLMTLAGASIVLFLQYRRFLTRSGYPVALLAVFGIVAAGLAFSGNIDKSSRRWQWGPSLLAVRDTPFQNLALLAEAGQFSLFANGLLFFSTPDPQTAEYAVHPAMLQHQAPSKVLVIGGGVGGLLGEVLKHEGVVRIDYVEPDPEVIELAEEYLPGSATAALFDRRVHLFHADAGAFVREAESPYDMVIMQLGDPANAEMNRFYTEEFFGRIARLLEPDGIFSFAVTTSPGMVGLSEAGLLQSVYSTLRTVFPEVLVIPGDNARFFAALRPGLLTKDPGELVSRIAERKLDLRYVREYYLFDYLNPMRLEYLQAVLGQSQSVRINKDFEPTCYFNSLLVWTTQSHPLLGKAFETISRVGCFPFWGMLGIIVFSLLIYFRSRYGTVRRALMLNMLIVGGVLMVLEMALLLGFQILEGFVYKQLALIISFFMAGMALGPGIVAVFSSRIKSARSWLFVVQSILAGHLMGTLGLFTLLQDQLQANAQAMCSVSVVFSILALTAGVLGGLHFALGVRTISNLPGSSDTMGPKLYALDLIGATSGILVASLFILPIYGLATTMPALAALSMAGALTLIH